MTRTVRYVTLCPCVSVPAFRQDTVTESSWQPLWKTPISLHVFWELVAMHWVFNLVRWPYSSDAPRPLLTSPLCPITIYGSSVTLPKFQMAPRLTFLIFSGSIKEPRYTYLSEAKASHRQRIWADVSSPAPHFLHNGLSISPIKWRCLLRVLCPVRRPVTTLDCILLKDKSLALVPRQEKARKSS
jgi:hypothetical protein